MTIDAPDSQAGLTAQQARRRLERDGPNELTARPPRSAWTAVAEQLASPLVALLLGGSVVSALVGHFVDAIAIATIVGINAVVGFVQEFRAERAVTALRAMTAPRASVVRDGDAQVVPAADVVVGDVLLLHPGDVVAADARLLEAHALAVDEAILTGESLPVDKQVGGTDEDAVLAERFGDVFLGTSVAAGTGRAVVEHIAKDSEIGRIASALDRAESSTTPLQARLAALGRVIVVVCVVLVAVVAAAALVRGFAWLDILLTSVSLAVAAVPEGLPTVVTIALAVGVHRMGQRGVLVRRLAAVETLGSATVICTDKTGTLTRGVMEVRETWGGDPSAVLEAAASACEATLAADGTGTGDAMELAILRAAREQGIERPEIDARNPRTHVEPFDAATRRMTVERRDGRVDVKGAFEVVVEACDEVPEGAKQALADLADRGLRVLAIASGKGDTLGLVGLLGLADPPRPEAVDAIAQMRRAGIRLVMITGDHPRTAKAIARELGLGTTDEELEQAVFARATAEDKLQIVSELRKRGEVVAMTGDGVNDAPSLQEADIGVAMGGAATEVTREAADMLLTGDDLGGIVDAIREGRVIYANIRKTIVYLLGGNSAELIYVLVATMAGLPMPLLPLQLLWINLLGEPLPGIALSIDPPAGDVLDERPRARSEALLGKRQWLEIGLVAALQATVVYLAFVWALDAHGVDVARTLGFSALIFGVILRALASRSPTLIYWELDPRTSPRLAAIVIVSVMLQIAIIEWPATQALFGLASLSMPLLGLALLLGLIPVTVIELAKLGARLTRRSASAARHRDR